MVYIILLVAIVGGEYIIKNYMDATYKIGDHRELFGGKIMINKLYNKGAFLNFMEQKKEIVKKVSGIILGLVLLLFVFMLPKKSSKLFKLGLTLALGGAISNVSDRYLRGHVIDYFSINSNKFKKLKNIVFNLADMAIFLGSLLMLLSALVDTVFKSGSHEASE